jgi:hypothetical protein
MRTYAVINITELELIDFSQIEETSRDTIRKSIDETQFVIKWTQEPTFIADGTVIPVGIYTHSECLELMDTPAWSQPIETI